MTNQPIEEKCCEKCWDLSLSDDTRTCFVTECPCHQSESIDLDEIDNKITDLIQRLPFEKRGEIWTLIYESRKQVITTAVEARERELTIKVAISKEPSPSANDHKEYNRGIREGFQMEREYILSIINPSKE